MNNIILKTYDAGINNYFPIQVNYSANQGLEKSIK